MIIVKVFYHPDYKKEILGFEISGHAHSGPYGHDLVCAGVSAISFGSVNAMLKLCAVDLQIEQAENEGGFLSVKVLPIKDKKEKQKLQLLIQGMMIALQTIERDYNEFIQIQKVYEEV